MKSSRKKFQIDRKLIALIKFILEAYDGMAYITTIDPNASIIEIYIAPGLESEVADIFNSIMRDHRHQCFEIKNDSNLNKNQNHNS